jgi:NAD(P)H-binding
VRIVEGDVLDTRTLEAAMAGQDVVYVNLAGPLEQQARNIVNAMEKDGVRRLILSARWVFTTRFRENGMAAFWTRIARQPVSSRHRGCFRNQLLVTDLQPLLCKGACSQF